MSAKSPSAKSPSAKSPSAKSPAEDNQAHPLWHKDRATLNQVMQGEPTDFHLAELARLKIRYATFPGAKDIKTDIEKVLVQWGLTEESLFEKTRAIHATGKVYRGGDSDREDWS